MFWLILILAVCFFVAWLLEPSLMKRGYNYLHRRPP